MKLSVVLVVYNMRREAARTLQSLSPAYQRQAPAGEYEVVVMENGSTEPLAETDIAALGPNFRYHFIGNADPSPARAMNLGMKMARGTHLCLMIDGARIATPGLLYWGLQGLALDPRALVAPLAWHLGREPQSEAVKNGYSKAVEDRLLADVAWPEDGYALFDIASLANSSGGGFFFPLAESNAFFLSREMAEELEGYDERFDLPGGGCVNLDFYARACALPQSELVILLGEGTFHQLHGGTSTNAAEPAVYKDRAFAQYAAIRGRAFVRPNPPTRYLGRVPRQVLPFMRHSLDFLETHPIPPAQR